MSRPAPFRQADVERAIKAARAAGLCVTGIRVDGTVITSEAEATQALPNDNAARDAATVFAERKATRPWARSK